MPDETIRRDLLCGRLVALPTSGGRMAAVFAQNAGFNNVISIDFPAMPDVLELNRSAEYAVNHNIVMPDGIHQYKGTKPMDIPFSFQLSAHDRQYCKQGALTLIQLAARLHSFVMPISTFGPGAIVAPKADDPAVQEGKPPEALTKALASQETIYTVTAANGRQNGAVYGPVTCWLHLMWVNETSPGISAIGYVREISVKFNGPWLRGPSNSFNLPTSADFSFVFVHRPGHGNAMQFTDSRFPPTIAQSGQAFADDVKDKLYNTRALVYAANYQGFASNPSGTTN